MKKLGRLMMAVTVLAVVAMPAFADTLVLTDGTRVSGYFEGGTARVVKFRGNDGAVKDYDILKVQQVLFESAPLPPTPSAASAAPAAPAPAAVAPAAPPTPVVNPAPAANTASTNTPAPKPSPSTSPS
jgi:hypothetical protein